MTALYHKPEPVDRKDPAQVEVADAANVDKICCLNLEIGCVETTALPHEKREA